MKSWDEQTGLMSLKHLEHLALIGFQERKLDFVTIDRDKRT